MACKKGWVPQKNPENGNFSTWYWVPIERVGAPLSKISNAKLVLGTKLGVVGVGTIFSRKIELVGSGLVF